MWNSTLIYLSLTYLFLGFTLISCQKSPDNAANNVGTEVIKVSYQKDAALNLFSKIRIEEVIPFETNKASVIGNFMKLLVTEDRFFALDAIEGKVYCFKKDGSFVSNVGIKGKGPGEYLSVEDIDLSTDAQQLFFLDYQKVQVYDAKTLEHQKTIPITFEDQIQYNPDNFVVFNESDMYFSFTFPDGRNSDDLDFYYLASYQDGNYSYHLPYDPGNYYTIGSPFTSNMHNKGSYFYVPFGNAPEVIKLYPNGKLESYYSISLPNPLPKRTAEPIPGRNIPLDEINTMIKDEHDKFIQQFFATRDQILFRFSGAGGKYRLSHYRKDEGTVKAGLRDSDLGYFPEILYADDQYFYGYFYAYYISKMQEENFEPSTPFTEALKQLEISDFDNPILFKFAIQ